jgi:hypothetical protein
MEKEKERKRKKERNKERNKENNKIIKCYLTLTIRWQGGL